MTHPLVLYMAISQRDDMLREAAGTRLAREARVANRSRKPGLVTSVVSHLRSLVASRPVKPATA
jgi:hypothetical protein